MLINLLVFSFFFKFLQVGSFLAFDKTLSPGSYDLFCQVRSLENVIAAWIKPTANIVSIEGSEFFFDKQTFNHVLV